MSKPTRRRRNKKGKDAIKPLFIPQRNFDAIKDFFDDQSPHMKNVFLSVSQYSMDELITSWENSAEKPTHLLVFCVRTLATNQYQPLAVLQIDERINQSKKIASVWRAFIHDLGAMGLKVIASISPCNDVFNYILKTFTKDAKQEGKPIFYPCYPFDEILHLFDPVSLVDEFQELFCLSVEVYFSTVLESEKDLYGDYRIGVASWNDILAVMAMANMECSYTRPYDGIAEKNYKVFSNSEFRSIYERISEEFYDNVKSDTKLYSDRVMQIIWNYNESYRSGTNSLWSLNHMQKAIDGQEELRLFLLSLRFKNTEKIFQPNQLATDNMVDLFTFPRPTRDLHEVREQTEVSSLGSESSMELDQVQIDRLIQDIDNSMSGCNEQAPLNEQMFNFMLNDANLVYAISDQDKKRKKRKKSNKVSDLNNFDLFINSGKCDDVQPQDLQDKLTRLKQVMTLEREERDKLMKRMGVSSKQFEKEINEVMGNLCEQKTVDEPMSSKRDKTKEKRRSKDNGTHESGYGTDREETKLEQKRNNSEIIPSLNTLNNSLAKLQKSYADISQMEMEANAVHSSREPSFLSNKVISDSLADLVNSTNIPPKHVIINVATLEGQTINLTKTEDNSSDFSDNHQLGDFETSFLSNLKLALDETDEKNISMKFVDTNKALDDDDRCSSETHTTSIEDEHMDHHAIKPLEKGPDMGKLIQDNVKKLRIANDWLSTLVGHTALKDILTNHKLSHVRCEIFTLSHIDHFVSIIKKSNESPGRVHAGSIDDPFNFRECWNMLLDASGVFIIT